MPRTTSHAEVKKRLMENPEFEEEYRRLKGSDPIPARPVSPGAVIQGELIARRWSVEQIALLLDCRPDEARSMIFAGEAIDPEMARKLSKAFGTSQEFWMNLEKVYRSHPDVENA